MIVTLLLVRLLLVSREKGDACVCKSGTVLTGRAGDGAGGERGRRDAGNFFSRLR